MQIKSKGLKFIIKYKAWSFILLIVLPIVVFKMIQKELDWKRLGKQGRITKGVICERKFFLSKRGDTVKFYYCFEMESHSYRNGVMYKYNIHDSDLNIGDSIDVVYLLNDPSINIDYLFLRSKGYIR